MILHSTYGGIHYGEKMTTAKFAELKNILKERQSG
jgi:hypothetical protein